MQLPTERNIAKGFTLVELVLVLVICALLAALIYPAVRNSWAAFASRSSADDFVRLLRQTRLYCTQTQQPCEIRFVKISDDAYAPEVYLFDEVGNSEKITASWTDTVASVSIATSSASYASPAAPQPIRFYPSGVSESVTLTLIESNNEKKMIRISAPSGIISVKTPNALGNADFANEIDQAKLFWNEQCAKTITQ